jgi:hypothetical protein
MNKNAMLKLFLVISLSISLLFGFQPAIAQQTSPIYSRQIESDELRDLMPEGCDMPKAKIPPEIAFASYFSDGKNLNATLWLSNPINTSLSFSRPEYSIILDVNPSGDLLEAKSEGVGAFLEMLDYQMRIRYTSDQNGSAWIGELIELSPTKETRLVDTMPINASDVYDNAQKKYVKISLDLSEINYPESYGILFLADYFLPEPGCHILDLISPPVYIPQPKFDIVITPPKKDIRPDETEYAEIRVNSSLQLEHDVTLSANSPKGLSIEFEPLRQTLQPGTVMTSKITMKAGSNVIPDNIHSIPITANLTFPVKLSLEKQAEIRQAFDEAEQKPNRADSSSGQQEVANQAPNATTPDSAMERRNPRADSSSGQQEVANQAPNATTPDSAMDLELVVGKMIDVERLDRIGVKTGQLLHGSSSVSQSDLNSSSVSLSDLNRFSSSFLEDINKDATLTVSVLPSVTATEHFVAFWTGWGGLVGLIAGSFIAGLAGLVFKRKSRSSDD